MTTMASQPHDCYWIVYSDADQRKHESSASLAFVWGIHRWPVNSPHKGPVTRKMLPFDDVIMSFKDLEWTLSDNSKNTTNHEVCTDLAKSSWTFFSGAYFTILCCTETYHNFTTYFTTTLVLMFWISQAYAIASCISAYFCDVAYALLKIKFGRDANRISMTSHRDRC